MNKINTSCDKKICNGPEWAVVKNKFIIVDDWNEHLVLNLNEVDDWLESYENLPNAEGVQSNLNFCLRGNLNLAITSSQLKTLKKRWEDWKNKHKKWYEGDKE